MEPADSFRGGNSRLLARQLDLLNWPVVVLDQRCEIVFVSGSLCKLLDVDATRLVGLDCSSVLPTDELPFRELRLILAPPSEVLHGQAAQRTIPWPPKSPTTFATQAFLPLIDDDPSVGLTLVLFGATDVLTARLQGLVKPQRAPREAADEVLIRLRSQWQQLDGLWPLLGTSSAIELSMRRAQLLVQSDVGGLVYGPEGVGKSEVVRGLAALRAKSLGLPANAIHAVPIDCRASDEVHVLSTLENFAARIRPGVGRTAFHLLLEHLDQATRTVVALLEEWLTEHGSKVCVLATSDCSPQRLYSQSHAMRRVIESFSTIELSMPAIADRRDDVPPLVQHCLTVAAQRASRRLPGIAPQTLELLTAYNWPGNVEEIRLVAAEMLNNAVLTATIQPSHLPLQIRTFGGTLTQARQTTVESISLDQVLQDLERIMLERAIRLSPRNRARAARMLGISRPRFLRRISQLGLDDSRSATSEEE